MEPAVPHGGPAERWRADRASVKRARENMTLQERLYEQIDRLRIFPNELALLVGKLTPAQLGTPYLAGEWTVAQNVHHLADSHMHSYTRCKFALAEENPTIKPYDQDVWAALPDASDVDLAPSMALLRGLHTRWADFFAALPEAAWARTIFHPERGTVTLGQLLDDYVAHGQGHIDQIARTLAAAQE
ncbi:metal-dependent hydrolase [Chloroflexia bacterium SDU3-3]|nr:metal-dependent hydrolase [Chloroflexia bacterium SDU3-3]